MGAAKPTPGRVPSRVATVGHRGLPQPALPPQLWQYWRQHYAPAALNTPARLELALASLVAAFNDPYTLYYPAAAFEAQQQALQAKLVGIGVELLQVQSAKGSHVVVKGVLPSSPAAQVGLQAGDELLRVADQATANLTLEACAALIRGPVGSTVTLQVQGAASAAAAPRWLTVPRQSLSLPNVAWHTFKRYPQVGYLRIQSFLGEALVQEVRQALYHLKTKRALVIDLRGNEGGLLQHAVALADLFLEEGPIVSLEGPSLQQPEPFYAKPGQLFAGRVWVWVDEHSASASEVFAAALQAHGRAVVVGRTTFGKGVVQQVEPLPNGGGLVYTLAVYKTPAGRSIHGVGVVPTLKVPRPLGVAQRLAAEALNAQTLGFVAAPQAPAGVEAAFAADPYTKAAGW
jgi:carboxyl-terminal processing protease